MARTKQTAGRIRKDNISRICSTMNEEESEECEEESEKKFFLREIQFAKEMSLMMARLAEEAELKG